MSIDADAVISKVITQTQNESLSDVFKKLAIGRIQRDLEDLLGVFGVRHLAKCRVTYKETLGCVEIRIYPREGLSQDEFKRVATTVQHLATSVQEPKP